MSALIAWLHTLTPAQNVMLSISACLVFAIIVIAVFVWWDNRYAPPKIEHIPEPRPRVVKGWPADPWK